MGLAAFGIQIGLMTAVGRGAYGHAVYPRYTTPATLAVLGLVLLASTAGAGMVPTPRRTRLMATMAALWVAMLAANSLAGRTAMIGYEGRMRPAQKALWNGHGDIAPLAIKHPLFQSLVETARANRWGAATGRFR